MKHHGGSTPHSAALEEVLPKMAVTMFCMNLIFPDCVPLEGGAEVFFFCAPQTQVGPGTQVTLFLYSLTK